MASLGRYEVLQEIGRGGEGVVYLAVDPTIDRKVAIKTLPIAEDPSGALRAKLQQEAKSTARLSHPNIVTVYEFAQQDHLAYIVMEYVAGKSLAASFDDGYSYDYQTVCRYLMQAAEALDHAHSMGVIHRDIKPENLMIQSRGGLKVADFGIAKVLDNVGGSATKTGVVRGTPYYLSPEQIDLKGISGRSDQFALAVVSYQWLAGRRPFEGDSWTELLTKILTKDPPPVSQFRDSLGEQVTVVLLKALAKDPANRYPTCVDFIHDLGYALGVASGDTRPAVSTQTLLLKSVTGNPPTAERPISTTTQAPAVPVPAARSRWPIYGVAATAAIAIAAVLFTRSMPSAAPPTIPTKPIETTSKTVPEPLPTVVTSVPKTVPSDPPKDDRKTSRPDPKQAAKKEIAKKAEPIAEPPPVKAKEPEPPPPTVTTPVVPADPEPAGKYFGPPEGRFSWAGSLAAGQNLVIASSRASVGALQGRGLPPSLEVSITADPPSIQVLSQPTASNGYRLTLKNSSSADVQSIVVRWKERKK